MNMKELNRSRLMSFEDWSLTNEARTYDNRDFSFDEIKKVQSFLVNGGFMDNTRQNGKPSIDGMFGRETKDALTKYQRSKGFANMGEIDDQTLRSMNLPTSSQRGGFSSMQGISYGVDRNLSRIADVDGDRIQIIDPSIVRLGFLPGFKRLNASQWMERGFKNFINLTFFEPDGRPTANFYANGINLGAKLGSFGRSWPMMILKPNLAIVENVSMFSTPQEAFSGSHIILKDGNLTKPSSTFRDAAIERRTAVGITFNDDVIVMVSNRSDARGMATKMQAAGARDVISMDGGGSPLFVRDGKMLISTKRALPTILAW